MATNILRGGESTPIVLLWPQQNNVKLGEKQQHQSNNSTKADAQAHRDDLRITAEVDRHKRHPDDESRVHGKPYELRLVEVLWHVPRLHCVHRTHGDEEEVESQRGDDA